MTPPGAAETAFRWLMRLYPARFRRAHGLALFELFRDEARDAYAGRGTPGLLALVATTAVDTVVTAPRTWLERERGAARAGSAWHLPDAIGLLQDFAVAARRLARAPAFTAVAVLMLAISIGAGTTVFSVADAILFRPLSSRDPSRVVRIAVRAGAGASGTAARRFSYREWVDYRDRARSFDDLAAVNLATFLVSAAGPTDQILGEIASGSYMSLVGARASHGRLLDPGDDRPGAPPVVVISDALWRNRFAAEPVIGRSVFLNRAAYTVVGVADPSTAGSFIGAPIDAWIPIESSGQALGANWRVDRGQRTLALIGRLRPGVAAAAAQGELQTIATAIAAEFSPGLHTRIEVSPGTLATGDQRRQASAFFGLLLGLALVVLIVACANVGNLVLARVIGRQREFAIRVALGAGRLRVARLLLAEALVLAAGGAAGALAVSQWATRLLTTISPLPTLTLRFDVHPNLHVLLFTVATAIVAAAIVGVAGALHAARPDFGPALKEDSTASIGGGRPARGRTALAVLQVAASLFLLTGAALFAKSVRAAAALPLGFDTDGVVALDVDAAGGRTNVESRRVFGDVVQRLERDPEVIAAAVSTRAPLDTSTPLVRVNAREAVATSGEDVFPSVTFTVVSAHYFDVVQTSLVAGRGFSEADDSGHEPVAIVNETLAAQLWPGEAAIGRRLWLEAHAAPQPCRVVGVARAGKYRSLGEEPAGHVYLPFAQQPRRGMTVLVRTRGTPEHAVRLVQEVLGSIDPDVQGFFARTLKEHVAVALLPVRIATWLTGIVAALALALAIVGLYAIVSHEVAERTQEIGLRKALGATDASLLALVLRRGLWLAGCGIALGVPAALVGTRLLGALLYSVSPFDPAAFGAASAVVVLVAMTACSVPARRAMRLDPAAALKRG